MFKSRFNFDENAMLTVLEVFSFVFSIYQLVMCLYYSESQLFFIILWSIWTLFCFIINLFSLLFHIKNLTKSQKILNSLKCYSKTVLFIISLLSSYSMILNKSIDSMLYYVLANDISFFILFSTYIIHKTQHSFLLIIVNTLIALTIHTIILIYSNANHNYFISQIVYSLLMIIVYYLLKLNITNQKSKYDTLNQINLYQSILLEEILFNSSDSLVSFETSTYNIIKRNKRFDELFSQKKPIENSQFKSDDCSEIRLNYSPSLINENSFKYNIIFEFKNIQSNLNLKSYLDDKSLTPSNKLTSLGIFVNGFEQDKIEIFIMTYENVTTLLIKSFFYEVKLNNCKNELKRRSEQFSKVAHEFKTPLICNSSLIDSLKDSLLKSQFNEAFKIANDIQKISEFTFYLIDDIMQSTSYGKRKSSIAINLEEKCPIDDIQFAYEILVVLLKLKDSNHNISHNLLIENQIQHYKINTDSTRLRQVLINFISNAVKFTKYGFIQIQCKVVSNYLEIIINDSGTGMKEEVHSQLFKDERVIDLEVNKVCNKYGTGTGLNVVKTICDLMGYKVTCNTIFGKGTTFILTIPTIKTELIEEDYFSQDEEDNLSDFSQNINDISGLETIKEEQQNNSSTSDITIRKQNRSFSTEIKYITNELGNINNSRMKKNYAKEVKEDINCQNISIKRKFSVISQETIVNNVVSYKRHSSVYSNFNNINSSIGKRNSLSSTRRKLNSSISNISSILKNKNSNSKIICKSPVDSKKLFDSQIYSSQKKMCSVKSLLIINKSIFIICDDHEIMRNSLKKNMYAIDNFEKLYGIDQSFDGIQVLWKVVDDQSKGNLIKAIFIDENMDFISGKETVKLLKRFEQEHKIKKLLYISISANDNEEPDDIYDWVLTKPISKTKLSECLKGLKLIY